jgi:23S rRNA pseudouridine2605 synthase
VQKVLARAGLASRRKAEALIAQGRVRVNGRIAQLGTRVSPDDEVTVDGRPIGADERRVTFAFYKPRGVLSSVGDDRGRKTVIDFFPPIPGLHPVGRLDLESEGLLLLTNDGELTNRLTHPSYGHEKVYRVWSAQGTLGAGELQALERGVELDDGPARAVVAKVAEGGCRLVLSEGRKRQVRRMLAAVGHRVERLKRERIGKLELGELQPGEYRELTAEEVEALKR